jgi:hypothetical protein
MDYHIAMSCDWTCVRCNRTWSAARVYRTSPYEKECRYCGTHDEWKAVLPTPPPSPPVTRETLTAKWDRNPLVAAAATGDLVWLQELLAAGEDVNEFTGAFEYSPLIVAAQLGHVDVVRTLLMTGKCDLTKKHMEYISALDSALFGYMNMEGEYDQQFTPEIRGMIIRAFLETADVISEELQLQIQATGTVEPDRFKAFRNVGGRRLAAKYPKAAPGRLNLAPPPDAALPGILLAARSAVVKLSTPVVTGTKKKTGGAAVAASRINTAAAEVAVGGAGARAADSDDEDDDGSTRRRKKPTTDDSWMDDKYGKMSRRFGF